MPKVEEVLEYLRMQIFQLQSKGISYRKISTQVSVPYPTGGSIIRKCEGYGTTGNLPRAGAPRRIGLRSRRHLLKHIKYEPMMTRKGF